jgi:hypothetical protein
LFSLELLLMLFLPRHPYLWESRTQLHHHAWWLSCCSFPLYWCCISCSSRDRVFHF